MPSTSMSRARPPSLTAVTPTLRTPITSGTVRQKTFTPFESVHSSAPRGALRVLTTFPGVTFSVKSGPADFPRRSGRAIFARFTESIRSKASASEGTLSRCSSDDDTSTSIPSGEVMPARRPFTSSQVRASSCSPTIRVRSSGVT